MSENVNKSSNVKHSKGPKKVGDKRMLIRYGKMASLGWFWHNLSSISKTKKDAVIKTERGLELGEIVGPYCYKSGQFRWDFDKVSQYYEENEPGDIITRRGTFVRYATAEDLSDSRHLEANSKGEKKSCQDIVDDMKLDMKIVDAEHIFGGERIIFYFSSEGRIDFRELVKRLAKEFQTRIEMRQIGARDEAKLISDFETCGQRCCCAQYLKILKPVNMKMAKTQKATLDPSKISGYCGRLKCCLRYEDDLYKELGRNMPSRGCRIKCEQGEGDVIECQTLTQLVKVRGRDGNIFAVGVEDIEVLPKDKSSENSEQKTEGRGPRSDKRNGNNRNGRGKKDGRPRRRDNNREQRPNNREQKSANSEPKTESDNSVNENVKEDNGS
jgi:cell fate regulator YaaT (PSP1 superfamily)